MHNLNYSIIIKKTKFLFLELSPKKSWGSDGFNGEIFVRFKKKLAPILHNLFHNTEEEGTLSNSFYEASITLIPKPKTVQEMQSTDQYSSWTLMPKSLTKC